MEALYTLSGVEKHVTLGSAPLVILRDIHLDLRRGEFVALMGASGSGKSTLLNILGLLDAPSEGRIELLGHDVSRLDEDARASWRARHIGFIFQSFNLLPYLTAQENVELAMAYTARAQRRERARELLAQMHMEHRLQAYPATLSGGEKQRVAIARALANEPELILADEPTGALDSTTGREVMELLAELHHRGATIALVTHDEAVARRAQRIVRLADGRILPS